MIFQCSVSPSPWLISLCIIEQHRSKGMELTSAPVRPGSHMVLGSGSWYNPCLLCSTMVNASWKPLWETQEQAAPGRGCRHGSDGGTAALLCKGAGWAAGNSMKGDTGLIPLVISALISRTFNDLLSLIELEYGINMILVYHPSFMHVYGS